MVMNVAMLAPFILEFAERGCQHYDFAAAQESSVGEGRVESVLGADRLASALRRTSGNPRLSTATVRQPVSVERCRTACLDIDHDDPMLLKCR
jgi:hypothetical protein